MQVGMLAIVNKFSFNNLCDNAAVTDSSFDFYKKIDTPVSVIIIEKFYDYECGYNFIGIIQEKPNNLEFEDEVIYFSEFSIIAAVTIPINDSLSALEKYKNHLIKRIKDIKENDEQDTAIWTNIYEKKYIDCLSKIKELTHD
jgi:hypothetical protein